MNNGPLFDGRTERSNAWKMLNRVDYSELTKDELDIIARTVRQAQKRLGKDTVNTLNVGDTVSWSSGRRRGKFGNMTFTGEVRKVNKTRVKVDSNGYGIWNVPGSLLTKVA